MYTWEIKFSCTSAIVPLTEEGKEAEISVSDKGGRMKEILKHLLDNSFDGINISMNNKIIHVMTPLEGLCVFAFVLKEIHISKIIDKNRVKQEQRC